MRHGEIVVEKRVRREGDISACKKASEGTGQR